MSAISVAVIHVDILSLWIAIVVGIFGIVGGLSTVAVFLVKYALLPWLQKHLVDPVQETRHQVKVNHHTSEEPTVLDKLDNVNNTAKQAVSIARENARHAKQSSILARQAIAEIEALARMYDGHLEWSQEEVDRIWKHLRDKGIDK
jgi:hypothetical protein